MLLQPLNPRNLAKVLLKRQILGDVPIISEESPEDDVQGKFPSKDGG